MLTKRDGQKLVRLVKAGQIKPEDYPGKSNQAFRLLIRSIRVTNERKGRDAV